MSLFSIAIFILIFEKLLLGWGKAKRWENLKRRIDAALFFILLLIIILINIDHFTLDKFLLDKQSQYIVLLCLLLIVSIIFLKKRLKLAERRTFRLTLLICLICSLLYIEFFNGAYTFESYEEFRSHSNVIKKHFIALPTKLVSAEKDILHVTDSDFNLYSYPTMFGTPFKAKDGVYYYYMFGGFGKMGNWWKLGVPIASQI